jgi:dTDP-4-amino-4,6-dideoxygalactose transaminase
LQPAFSDLGYRTGAFPHAEQAANEVLSLPMYPELDFDQCEIVSRAVRKLAASSGERVTTGAAA